MGDKQNQSPVGTILFGLLFCLAGLGLSLLAITGVLRDYHVTNDFREAQCTVLSKRTVSGKNAPLALVDISLQLDGHTYASKDLPLRNPETQVTLQKPVACLYNPKDPSQMVLAQESSGLPIGPALLLFLLAAALVTIGVRAILGTRRPAES